MITETNLPVTAELFESTVELFFPRKYDALAELDGDQDEADNEPVAAELAEV